MKMVPLASVLKNHTHALSNTGFADAIARLVATIVIVGLIAVAQEEMSPPLKIATRPPSVVVFTSFEPGERLGQLRLRVALGPSTPASLPGRVEPPKVEVRNTARGVGRSIVMSFDATTISFVGTIEGFESTLTGFVQIGVVDGTGQPEYHFASFAMAAPTLKPVTPIHTTDGQMTLFLTSSSFPAGVRIVASTQERPSIPLPTGVALASGPFDIRALGQPDVAVKSVVNIRLPAEDVRTRVKSKYVVRRLDPVTGTWNRLPSLADQHGLVQAASDHLGTFVLTTE